MIWADTYPVGTTRRSSEASKILPAKCPSFDAYLGNHSVPEVAALRFRKIHLVEYPVRRSGNIYGVANGIIPLPEESSN